MNEAYPKLVRDRIPEIIKSNEGLEPSTLQIKEPPRLRRLLSNKLDEEAVQYRLAESREHKTEKLADIFEVLCAYAQIDDYPTEILLNAFQKRRSADIAIGRSFDEIGSKIRQALSPSERLDLCADALQIVAERAENDCIRFDDICDARLQKLTESGGFLGGVVMLEPV